MQGFGVVKAVLSGDTVVVQGVPKVAGAPAPEMVLGLSNITAPRISRHPDQKDEPFGWQSREFLRKMCVGRQVKFRVDGASTGTKEGARQFATLWVCTAPGTPASQSINLAIATAGMGRVGDALSARGDEFAALESAGRVAQDGNVGMWAHDPGQGVRRQIWQLSAEQAGALASELKDKPIQAVVESVLSGSSVRVCIPLANNGPHIMSTFHIAAVQCPRAAAPAPPAGAAAPAAPQDKAEPYGNEARAFAESRLLHRDVALHIGGADKSGAFVGRVEHPAGDIAAELLKAGLGKVVDWSASFDSPGHVGSLRAAERAAKSAKAKVWASYEPSTSKLAPAAREYMGRVVEVASGDSIVVLTNPGRAAGVAPDERRVSLSSLKAPRLGNPRREEKDAPWAWEAKEHLRRALIGREVHVAVDYTRAGAVQEDAAGRPLAGGAAAPDRVFGTVTLETKKGEAVNVAVGLLEAGYAEVVKHRAEEDRARDYDRLLEAEAAARSGKKGLHSAKGAEGAPVHRVADITGDSVKAKAQFPFLKRAGSLRAVVEHVFAGGRVKLYFPSEQVAVMFGIAAVRCPAVGKAAAGGGKGAAATPSEPMGPEALQYMRETVLQQEVEVECEEVDRNGTVLGPLYLGKGGARKNIGAELLKRGLGRAVWPVVERVRDSEELVAAEEEAKAVKKGLWAFVKEEEEADGAGAGSGAAGARGASATLGDAFASLNLDKAVVAAAPSSAAGEAPSPAIPCVLADITDGRHFTLQAEADRERIAAVNAALDALYEQHGLKHEIVPDLRKGKVVACLFDEGAEGGKRWYRGRIDGKAASGGKTTVSPAAVDETGLERWEVTYMDYGNCGVATVMSMRPLDASTAAHPPFARRGGLAYLRVPTVQAEHGAEAAAMLSDIAFGRPLLAHAHGVDSLAPDSDASVASGAGGPAAPRLALDLIDAESGDSVNESLVRAGLARVSKSESRRVRKRLGLTLPPRGVVPSVTFYEQETAAACAAGIDSQPHYVYLRAMEKAQEEARRGRRGMFRYGDVADSDEEGLTGASSKPAASGGAWAAKAAAKK